MMLCLEFSNQDVSYLVLKFPPFTCKCKVLLFFIDGQEFLENHLL